MATLITTKNCAKGVYTFLLTPASTSAEYVIKIPSVPANRPVPGFSVLQSFNDVLNTAELVIVKTLYTGYRCGYLLPGFTDNDLIFYHELRSPLPDPLSVQVWRL